MSFVASAGPDQANEPFDDFEAAKLWLLGVMEARACEDEAAGRQRYLRLAKSMIEGYRAPFRQTAEDGLTYSILPTEAA